MDGYPESYKEHASLIEKDPNHIQTLNRPPKGLIAYALKLDPHSFPFPLRLKKPYKISSVCCLYHNNRDLRRGYVANAVSTSPKLCRKAPLKYQNIPLENTDYSSMPIASQYYADDIDRILRYAGRNLRVLDQLDDNLADELEEFLINEHNNRPSFLSRLLSSLHEYIKYMYNLN